MRRRTFWRYIWYADSDCSTAIHSDVVEAREVLAAEQHRGLRRR